MSSRSSRSRVRIAGRIAWTLVTLVIVQSIVCAIALLPPALIGFWLWSAVDGAWAAVLAAAAAVPLYVLFALLLLVVSPLALRALGWHAPPDAVLRIADLEWPLLHWARYGASLHLVRVLAGTLFRGTPFWTLHARLAGATLGRRVYINSLYVSDYNLITCGSDVVIGNAVHMSGHTVEDGCLKTARIRVGDHVTIGLGSVVEIGAEIGSHVQIGALSFVPKHARLAAGRVYVGAPVAPLEEVHR